MPMFNRLNKKTLIGLDCEWNYCDGTETIARKLQKFFPYEKSVVMSFSQMNAHTKESSPEMLKNLLELDCVAWYERLISIDCPRLEKLGDHIRNRCELRNGFICNNNNFKTNRNMGG